jgi:hypothetical protein
MPPAVPTGPKIEPRVPKKVAPMIAPSPASRRWAISRMSSSVTPAASAESRPSRPPKSISARTSTLVTVRAVPFDITVVSVGAGEKLRVSPLRNLPSVKGPWTSVACVTGSPWSRVMRTRPIDISSSRTSRVSSSQRRDVRRRSNARGVVDAGAGGSGDGQRSSGRTFGVGVGVGARTARGAASRARAGAGKLPRCCARRPSSVLAGADRPLAGFAAAAWRAARARSTARSAS